MTNNKTKIKSSDIIVLIILILSLLLMYFSDKIISNFKISDSDLESSQKIAKEIANLVLSLNGIAFDTTPLISNHMRNVKTLTEYPINTSPEIYGKSNPFSNYSVINKPPIQNQKNISNPIKKTPSTINKKR